MKREGKNTTTLLSIKGFLWEDIKSLRIFLSAPTSGNIPAGSTHSSPFKSATINFYVGIQEKNKGWGILPKAQCICSWVGVAGTSASAGLATQVACGKFTHPCTGVFKEDCPIACFLMQAALISAKFFSCVSGNNFLGTIHPSCLPHQRVSESDGWDYTAENHASPLTRVIFSH